MSQILFQSTSDISNDWLFYIENEAKSLAQRDDFAIQNYLDREIFNPEVQSYLASEKAATVFNSSTLAETLNLNLTQSLKATSLPDWLHPRFEMLKTKIRGIFCSVIQTTEGVDLQTIIKTVVAGLIPLFAIVGGMPAAVLPIIIGLIAYLYKYGIEKTCSI